MLDLSPGDIAAGDQWAAAVAQFARLTATYYHTLRREGVLPQQATAFTLQWQAAQLAKMLGLEVSDAG